MTEDGLNLKNNNFNYKNIHTGVRNTEKTDMDNQLKARNNDNLTMNIPKKIMNTENVRICYHSLNSFH